MQQYTENSEGYTLIPVLPVDGYIHNDSCFCDDMACECHENEESIGDLQEAVEAGEITGAEADLIYRAKTV